MRQNPITSQNMPLNPNDFSGPKNAEGIGGARSPPGFQKKQFADMNQHYIHHNAVLPPDAPGGVQTRN